MLSIFSFRSINPRVSNSVAQASAGHTRSYLYKNKNRKFFAGVGIRFLISYHIISRIMVGFPPLSSQIYISLQFAVLDRFLKHFFTSLNLSQHFSVVFGRILSFFVMLLPFFLAPRHGRLGFERNMLQRTERWGGNPNLHLKNSCIF